MAPGVNEMMSRSIDLKTFWPGSRSRRNDVHEHRFEDFLALAQEVEKMTARRIDLKRFWHWLQKSTKSCLGASIQRIPREFPDNYQTIPREFPDNSRIILETNIENP